MTKHWTKQASKQCECGAIFERIGNTNDRRWEDTKHCPKCRMSRTKNEDAENRQLGHYKVNSAVINKFLRGGT